MSNATVQHIGSINSSDANATTQRSLFLKLFSGEVITAFEKHTLTLDKHNVRTISNGKSA